MKTFWQWIKENSSNIQINLQQLQKKLQFSANETINSMHNRHQKATNFDANSFINNIKNKFSGKYPLIDNLIKALQTKNKHYIWDQYKKAYEWITAQPYQETQDLRPILRQIWTYIDQIEAFEPNEDEIWELVKKALEESQKNMEEIKSLISQAISRIPNFHNSVTIIALSNENNIETAESAEIILGTGENSPFFTIFKHENKIEIDDVLEGGDEDFFHNPQIQSDYFNLINELRNPGSTGKGKILTLYTARPRKDREKLLQSGTLPLNIFLVNDYDHAEGLAADFGERDIWKVKIDNRYLTQTLDGKIKYFQVTVDNAPAKLDLI